MKKSELRREIRQVTQEIEVAKKTFRKLLKPLQERRALLMSRSYYFRPKRARKTATNLK